MAPRTNSSKLRNAGAAAYWGYKAFQALRVSFRYWEIVASIVEKATFD